MLPQRKLRYTSLPPGEFRFLVQAVDARGQAGPVVSSPPIRVQPPLWSRPWASGLVAAVLLALTWLVFSVVTGRRYARRLQQRGAPPAPRT